MHYECTLGIVEKLQTVHLGLCAMGCLGYVVDGGPFTGYHVLGTGHWMICTECCVLCTRYDLSAAFIILFTLCAAW